MSSVVFAKKGQGHGGPNDTANAGTTVACSNLLAFRQLFTKDSGEDSSTNNYHGFRRTDEIVKSCQAIRNRICDEIDQLQALLRTSKRARTKQDRSSAATTSRGHKDVSFSQADLNDTNQKMKRPVGRPPKKRPSLTLDTQNEENVTVSTGGFRGFSPNSKIRKLCQERLESINQQLLAHTAFNGFTPDDPLRLACVEKLERIKKDIDEAVKFEGFDAEHPLRIKCLQSYNGIKDEICDIMKLVENKNNMANGAAKINQDSEHMSSSANAVNTPEILLDRTHEPAAGVPLESILPCTLSHINSDGFPVIVTHPLPPKPLCFLCGSAGIDQLLFCSVCCEPYHPFCIGDSALTSMWTRMEDRQLTFYGVSGNLGVSGDQTTESSLDILSTWTCNRCWSCASCGGHQSLVDGKTQDPPEFFRCKTCRQPFHKLCAGKRYSVVSGESCDLSDHFNWICDNCVKCKSCGKSLESLDKKYARKKLVESSMLCLECFKQIQKGSYCPLCNSSYDDNDYETRMMECGHCDRWVHARCENITEEQYQLLSHLPECIEFVCRLCDETDGSPLWKQAINIEVTSGCEDAVRMFFKAVLTDNRKRRRLTFEEYDPSISSEARTDDSSISSEKKPKREVIIRASNSSTELKKFLGGNKFNGTSNDEPEILTNGASNSKAANGHTEAGILDRARRSLRASARSNTKLEIPDSEEQPNACVKIVRQTETKSGETEDCDDVLIAEENILKPKTDAALSTTAKGETTTKNSCSETSELFSLPVNSSVRMLRSLEKSWMNQGEREDASEKHLDELETPSTPQKLSSPIKKASSFVDLLKNNQLLQNCFSVATFFKIVELTIEQYLADSESVQKKNWMSSMRTALYERFTWLTDDILHQRDEDTTSQNDGSSSCLSVGRLQQFLSITWDNEARDERTCAFCRATGDLDSDDRGRLLWAGLNEWIHINCALWSSEIWEEENGALQQVSQALTRSKSLVCSRCKETGATVSCCHSQCRNTYHFHCAVKAGCYMKVDKSVFCKSHNVKQNRLQTDFHVHRRVFVDLDWIKKKEKHVLSTDVSVVIGSLLVKKLGCLNAQSVILLSELFGGNQTEKSLLMPSGFHCSRFYWSITDPLQVQQYAVSTQIDGCFKQKTVLQDFHAIVDYSSKYSEILEQQRRIQSFHNWLATAPLFIDENEDEWHDPYEEKEPDCSLINSQQVFPTICIADYDLVSQRLQEVKNSLVNLIEKYIHEILAYTFTETEPVTKRVPLSPVNKPMVSPRPTKCPVENKASAVANLLQQKAQKNPEFCRKLFLCMVDGAVDSSSSSETSSPTGSSTGSDENSKSAHSSSDDDDFKNVRITRSRFKDNKPKGAPVFRQDPPSVTSKRSLRSSHHMSSTVECSRCHRKFDGHVALKRHKSRCNASESGGSKPATRFQRSKNLQNVKASDSPSTSGNTSRKKGESNTLEIKKTVNGNQNTLIRGQSTESNKDNCYAVTSSSTANISHENPTTCDRCNLTYRTYESYMRHRSQCVQYSSSSEATTESEGENESELPDQNSNLACLNYEVATPASTFCVSNEETLSMNVDESMDDFSSDGESEAATTEESDAEIVTHGQSNNAALSYNDSASYFVDPVEGLHHHENRTHVDNNVIVTGKNSSSSPDVSGGLEATVVPTYCIDNNSSINGLAQSSLSANTAEVLLRDFPDQNGLYTSVPQVYSVTSNAQHAALNATVGASDGSCPGGYSLLVPGASGASFQSNAYGNEPFIPVSKSSVGTYSSNINLSNAYISRMQNNIPRMFFGENCSISVRHPEESTPSPTSTYCGGPQQVNILPESRRVVQARSFQAQAGSLPNVFMRDPNENNTLQQSPFHVRSSDPVLAHVDVNKPAVWQSPASQLAAQSLNEMSAGVGSCFRSTVGHIMEQNFVSNDESQYGTVFLSNNPQDQQVRPSNGPCSTYPLPLSQDAVLLSSVPKNLPTPALCGVNQHHSCCDPMSTRQVPSVNGFPLLQVNAPQVVNAIPKVAEVSVMNVNLVENLPCHNSQNVFQNPINQATNQVVHIVNFDETLQRTLPSTDQDLLYADRQTDVDQPTRRHAVTCRLPASNNVAVVRPMENPLQRLTNQISQLGMNLSSMPGIQNIPSETIIPVEKHAVQSQFLDEAPQNEMMKAIVSKPVELKPQEPTVLNNINPIVKSQLNLPMDEEVAVAKDHKVLNSRRREESATTTLGTSIVNLSLLRTNGKDEYNVSNLVLQPLPSSQALTGLRIMAKSPDDVSIIKVEPTMKTVSIKEESVDEFNYETDDVPISCPSKNSRLVRRAVIVFEVKSHGETLFRSSKAHEVWAFIFERVQGARSELSLHKQPYPGNVKDIRDSRIGRMECLRMLGVTHQAVQFLLEQLPGRSAVVHKHSFKFHAPRPDEIPLPVNPTGSARSGSFRGRKPFDMFGWLASKHREVPQLSQSMSDWSQQDLPIAMRYRNLREKSTLSLGVYYSAIHGRGLFTGREIQEGEMIIEYAGEIIRAILSDVREKYYESKGIGCYFFTIDENTVIDATMKGNAARFINHSCEPNCKSKAVEIFGKKHILIFAERRIQAGEELTYDYKFALEDLDKKIPCTCGARKCRKYLN